MTDQLLTLAQAAAMLGLRSGETFARFARRHSIPLVRAGRRVVRVRLSALERFIEQHSEERGDPEIPVTTIPILKKAWSELHGRGVQGGALRAENSRNAKKTKDLAQRPDFTAPKVKRN